MPQPFLHTQRDGTGYPLAESTHFRAFPDHGRVGSVSRELALYGKETTMKTLSATLPGFLSDMSRDRPVPAEFLGPPFEEPQTTQHEELSEYELDHNDPERFGFEDELLQLGLGFGDLAESEDGLCEEDGFWSRLSTRTKLMGSETGMATAEYAIATLAAVGLAGLLVVILRSEEVRGFLLNLIRTALSLP